MPRKRAKTLAHLYPEIVRLFEQGYSYTQGAKMLGISSGSFAGTIHKLREKGVTVEREVRKVDARHRIVEAKPTLSKLKFMEDGK